MRCSVPCCPNFSNGSSRKSLFRIPNNINTKMEWCQILGINPEMKRSLICEDHFKYVDIIYLNERVRLSHDAKPQHSFETCYNCKKAKNIRRETEGNTLTPTIEHSSTTKRTNFCSNSEFNSGCCDYQTISSVSANKIIVLESDSWTRNDEFANLSHSNSLVSSKTDLEDNILLSKPMINEIICEEISVDSSSSAMCVEGLERISNQREVNHAACSIDVMPDSGDDLYTANTVQAAIDDSSNCMVLRPDSGNDLFKVDVATKKIEAMYESNMENCNAHQNLNPAPLFADSFESYLTLLNATPNMMMAVSPNLRSITIEADCVMMVDSEAATEGNSINTTDQINFPSRTISFFVFGMINDLS